MTCKGSASSSFEIQSWQEQPILDGGAVRIHSTHLTKQFRGDLEGSSQGDMLMTHVDGTPVAYCGFESVTATLDGRSGGFVFHHNAASGVEGGISLTVVPGSGTGQLAGISGTARIVADGEAGGGDTRRLVFDYQLD